MQPSNLLPRALALALLLSACASRQKSEDAVVRDAVNHGQFDQAVREADRLRREHPGDPEFEALHREATIAWLLAKGREETLEDNDLAALGLFHRALQIDPESVETAVWIDKTVRKMSRIWLELGLELHASGKLEEAIEAYSKALEYVPDDLSALNGLGEAVIQVNYREGMGKEYFDEGLAALSDYWLQRAKSRFSYSDKYKPGEEKTGQRRDQVDVLIAQQRVTVALGIEASGRFAAARNEFRLAHALDPKNEEAKAGFERNDKEFRAFELLAQAKMEIVRGRVEHAVALIEEGEALTTAQKELFEGARDQIQQRGFDELYQLGLARERELEYDAAVATYTDLLSKAEYYKDALARRDMLVEYIRLAAELYAQVQATTDGQSKLEALRKISVFWPEYKDVAEQLERLEKP